MAIGYLFVHWTDYFLHHYLYVDPNRLISAMLTSANIQANDSEISVVELVCSINSSRGT